MKIDLTGRTALVTGASQGIGREIATLLAQAGANVAHADLKECADIGDKAVAVKADVSKPDDCAAAVKACVDAFGGLDILVNNAGITRDGLLLRMKPEDWDLVLGVNLRSVFLMTKAAARPLMKSQAGRIVNIASVAGIFGNAGQANYAASKGGVISLTKVVAREFASRKICVNAVAPGFIETAMAAAVDQKAIDAALANIPAKRMGQPKEIADAVLFLASDLAAYITGHTLVVDGGMAM